MEQTISNDTLDPQVGDQPDIPQGEPQTPPDNSGGGQSDPPSKKLWEYLNKTQIYTKGYDDFQKQFSTPEKIDGLHHYLDSTEVYTKGKDSFYNQFFPQQKQTPEHHIVENPFTKVDNNFFNNPIQNPSESTSIGVTKPNIVVPKSFQSPHDLMNKNVADAHNKLQQAFAKSSDDVIDALNEQKHNQDYYNSLQGGKSKQDATSVAILPPPVRLPDQIKADREQFKQAAKQDPELARKVLSGVATTPELKSALYTVDAQNRPQNAHLINQNIEGIKNGELNYNSEHQQVIKNLPFAQSIVKGIQDHTQTMNDYDDYKKMSDDQILAKEAKATNNFNPDIPKEVPSGVGGMIGSNAVPLAKGVGASAVAGLLPETLAAASPWLAAMYSSSDFYKTAYANTLRTTLQKQIANGVDPHVALQKAKDDANFNANLAYAQGVAMTAAGLKLGGKVGGEYTPTQSVKNILKDVGTQSLIAGGAKVAENVHAGEAPLKDVDEAMGTNGLFMLALGALHKAPDLTVKAFKAVRNSVASQPQEMINQTLADGVKTGVFTPEAAQDIHNKVSEVKQNATGLPPDVPEENIPKIQKLIQRRTELENQMDKDHPSYVDPAYHAEIKEQINGVKKETADGKTEGKDGINEQIRKLSQPTKEETEQQPIQTFKKSAGVTLPEEKEGAALEQGNVTEGGTAPYSSNDSFLEAGKKSNETQDPSHLGKWIVDNAQTGDKIKIDEDSEYRVVRKTRNGVTEIQLEHWFKNDNGEWENNPSGIKILTDKYKGTESEKLGYRSASDLFQHAYTDKNGNRVVEQHSYIPKEKESAPSNSIQTNDNYKTAYVGNHEGKQEFKYYTYKGKRYPMDESQNENYIKENPWAKEHLEKNPNSQKFLSENEDAKLDKSDESQTEDKQQQVKNISKWNVPLDADENGEGGKGDTMAESVGRVVGQYLKDKAETDGHTAILAHSSVLKMIKTYEELKDRPEFKDANWNDPKTFTPEQAKIFTDAYNKESTNNGDTEEFDAGNGKKIYVSRHGQTEDNLTGKFRTEDTQLTDKGREQAKEVGKTLKEKGVNKIISSPFDRATETSQIAMKEMEGGKKGVSVVRPEDNKSPKVIAPVKEEKIPYDDFREEMLDHFKNQKDSKFDWRVSNELSQAERERGVDDLRNGKNSAAAKKVEAAIKDMYDKGVVPMNRGRGTQVQSHDFDFKDLGYTQKTVNGIEKNLHDWLLGESELTPEDELFIENNIDKIIQNETENERQNKPITGSSKATGTENIGEEVGGKQNQSQVNTKENAIPKQEAGGVGVRNEATLRKEVGGNDRPIEPTGEGGQQPPTEEKGKTTGEEEGRNTIGARHASLEKMAKRLGLKEPERGTFLTPEEQLNRGRMLLKEGADPEQIRKDFETDGKVSADTISVARAHQEVLGREADALKGTPEYEAAKEKFDEWNRNVVKKMGTASGSSFNALQGETDLDTGSFTAVSKAVEDKNGDKPLSPKQTKTVENLTSKNKKLKSELEASDEKLKTATDKSILKDTGKPSRAKLSTQLKDIAKRLRTSSEFDEFLKGANGNAQKMGVDLPRLKEIVASILEDAAKVVEKGENAIDFIRKAVKELKDDVDKDKLSEALIGIGEKQGLFETKETPEETFERNKNQGLVKSKMEKPLTDAEKMESDQKDLEKLQDKFADKKGTNFSADEKKDIYGYMKEHYLDKGVAWQDAIANTGKDIGLTFKQVSEAITTPETKEISTQRWAKMAELQRNMAATKRYVDETNASPAIKLFKKASALIRAESVFGHGGVFVGTHAMGTLLDPMHSAKAVKAFLNNYTLAYGSDANHALAISDLTNRPTYLLARRAGLSNDVSLRAIHDPDSEISNTYIGRLASDSKFAKALKWFNRAGEKGFLALKILRQDIFDSYYNNLTPEEKSDPKVLKNIAEHANNMTNASSTKIGGKIGELANETLFAPQMEIARWKTLAYNPAKAAIKLGDMVKKAAKGEEISNADKFFVKQTAIHTGAMLGTFLASRAILIAVHNYFSPDKQTDLDDWHNWVGNDFQVGDIHVNATSGLGSAANFIYNTLPAAITGTRHERVNGQNYKKDLDEGERLSLIANYGRGKLAPFYSLLTDVTSGKDVQGNQLPFKGLFEKDIDTKKMAPWAHTMDWKEFGEKHLPIPFAEGFNNFYESAKQNGSDDKSTNAYVQSVLLGALSAITGIRAYKKEEPHLGRKWQKEQ